MKLEKEYRYNRNLYQEDHSDYNNELYFLDLIKDFQIDFSEENSHISANFLYTNIEGMQLIKSCFTSVDDDLSDEIFGQDFVVDDMDKNFEINQKMDGASAKTLVYAISTEFEPDEPLCLIIDNTIAQDCLVLKYISDSDDDEVKELSPVGEVSLVE
jgi:hypothetical protein